MAYKRLRDSQTSHPEASLAARSLKLLKWPWSAHAQESFSFLNEGCEYLDLELSETDDSREFTFHSESAAASFDGERFGEVHL